MNIVDHGENPFDANHKPQKKTLTTHKIQQLFYQMKDLDHM
jgi:hypothetical protein